MVIMTDRFYMLKQAVTTSRTRSTQMVSMFYDHWIVTYGIPACLLTDTEAQCVYKFFKTICNFFGLKNRTTTTYHSNTNQQVDRYNSTLITRLRNYVAEHLRNRDIIVQLRPYADDNQINRSTGTTPFSVVLIIETSAWPNHFQPLISFSDRQ